MCAVGARGEGGCEPQGQTWEGLAGRTRPSTFRGVQGGFSSSSVGPVWV